MAVVTKRSFEEALLEKSDWGEITWEAVLVFFSTYAAPILFLLTFFSIAETLFETPKWYDFSVLVGQVFGLDSAGAGLVTRGMKLAEKGKGKAGAWAIVAGGIIVLVTVVSVACVAIPNAIPSAISWTKPTEAVLIIVRVVGSVCYGFILKLVKGASGDHRYQSSRQIQQREDALTQEINTLHSSLQSMQQKISSIPPTEKIDYQQIVSQIAPLVSVQEISAQPQPIDYHAVAQQIAPLLVPPPVPTTQDIIKELKPYLDSLKPVAQSAPPERITQANIPAVHPFLVPVETKNAPLQPVQGGTKSGAMNEIYVPHQVVQGGTNTPLYVPPTAVKNVPLHTTQSGTKSGTTVPPKVVQGGTKSGANTGTNAPLKPVQSGTKSGTRGGTKMTDEERLEAEYRAVVQGGNVPSQRALATSTGIDRRKVMRWWNESGKGPVQGGTKSGAMMA